MSQQLLERISMLRSEIDVANSDMRDALLAQLDQAVLLLESKGKPAPPWAAQILGPYRAEHDEDMFENMPI